MRGTLPTDSLWCWRNETATEEEQFWPRSHSLTTHKLCWVGGILQRNRDKERILTKLILKLLVLLPSSFILFPDINKSSRTLEIITGLVEGVYIQQFVISKDVKKMKNQSKSGIGSCQGVVNIIDRRDRSSFDIMQLKLLNRRSLEKLFVCFHFL